VHRHLGNAYRKLGVADRVRAVLVAAEAGLLEEEDDRFVASDVPAV
jgi:ATP/maltotriose-dependent transcriptional regulator MalT